MGSQQSWDSRSHLGAGRPSTAAPPSASCGGSRPPSRPYSKERVGGLQGMRFCVPRTPEPPAPICWYLSMPARSCRCFLESSALPPQAAYGAEQGGCREAGLGVHSRVPLGTHIHVQPEAVALAHVRHRAQRVKGTQHGGARGGTDKEWHGTLGTGPCVGTGGHQSGSGDSAWGRGSPGSHPCPGLTSLFTLSISFSSSSGIIFPLKDAAGLGSAAGPGVPARSQH